MSSATIFAQCLKGKAVPAKEIMYKTGAYWETTCKADILTHSIIVKNREITRARMLASPSVLVGLGGLCSFADSNVIISKL